MNGGAAFIGAHAWFVHQRRSCAEGAVFVQLNRADLVEIAAVVCAVARVDKGLHMFKSREGSLFSDAQRQLAFCFQLLICFDDAGALAARQGKEVVRIHAGDTVGVDILLRGEDHFLDLVYGRLVHGVVAELDGSLGEDALFLVYLLDIIGGLLEAHDDFQTLGVDGRLGRTL